MKNILFISFLLLFTADLKAQKYEFLQMTTVESVVPAGIGRSRMITVSDKGKLEEVKMKNFFSITGINFGNIRQNDLQIALKLSDLSDQGWELISTTTGVYGAGAGTGSTGIFITRYLLRKAKE